MSVILELAEAPVLEMAREIIAQHHKHLIFQDGQQVRLCIMMARQPDDKREEPAIKHDGYAVAAQVSIIPYKQRVDKRADAEIIIDGRLWEDMTDRRRRALLDHQITCIELQTDGETGAVKTDDVGRPKLTLRNCDWRLQGFESIARRYEADALEVMEARKFQQVYGKFTLEEQAPEKDAEQQTIFLDR